MRRHALFTLLSSVSLLVGGCFQNGDADRPRLCLPAVFDQGQRLHRPDTLDVLWLDLLLRQHEVCWREAAAPSEVRVFLYGNSAVFGLPLPAEQSVGYLLNEHFTGETPPVHVFNLGMAFGYQVKDALIVRESLTFGPDVIVYGANLSDFEHTAPLPWPELLGFFENNTVETIRFAEERPEGLTAPLDAYRAYLTDPRVRYTRNFRIREVGRFVRAVVRERMKTVRRWLAPGESPAVGRTEGRNTSYDCTKTKAEFAERFRNWKDWSIIAYLAQVREATGTEVVVVNWPVAREPVEDCYNIRFPNAAVEEYTRWLAGETVKRRLHYVDLQDLLGADDFMDSLHVSAAGNQKIAARLQDEMKRILRDEMRRRQVG